jgi:hypothetical protein
VGPDVMVWGVKVEFTFVAINELPPTDNGRVWTYPIT